MCVWFRMELKAQMRSYVMKHLPTLRDKFQFSWSNDLDLLSNIGKFILLSFLLALRISSSCLDIG